LVKKTCFEQTSVSANKGVIFKNSNQESIIETQKSYKDDENLELREKALRRFIRSNIPINDTVFRLRLSNKADYFLKYYARFD
jgi:hypothetical protein